MTIERERQFKDLVAEFPDAPMCHFSLGKYYLDERRYAESAAALEQAVHLDGAYAAALVALGDAYAGLGESGKARDAYGKARRTPLGQRDQSLNAEIDGRLEELG